MQTSRGKIPPDPKAKIAQLIRRWEMCNANTDNYGVYEMRDLIDDILKAIERAKPRA